MTRSWIILGALGAMAACSIPSKLPSLGDDDGSSGTGTGIDGGNGSGSGSGSGSGGDDTDAGTPPDAASTIARCAGQPDHPRVFVYMRTTADVHDSIPDAQAAMLNMCNTDGFTVAVTADPTKLDAAALAETDVLVVALASGTVFDPEQRIAIEAWARAGGGIVGLHTATTIDTDWPYWTQIVGATMVQRSSVQQAKVNVVVNHAIVEPLPDHWNRMDEWYTFADRPELNYGMTMLLSLDEGSMKNYSDDAKVGFHPLVWCHELYGGRVVQSAIGHTKQSYSDPTYLGFVARSIRWAAHQL